MSQSFRSVVIRCLALGGCLACWSAQTADVQAPEKVIPVVNVVDPFAAVGQQPYEMTWVQRAENPHTLVDFEDLRGWNFELYDGASGEFRRSREEQMWGQYVGKFVYSGTRPGSRIVGRPPKPIAIPGAFDCVELWGYGNRWRHGRTDHTPPVWDVSVLVADSAGREHRIELADIGWKQWWLMHRRVPTDVLRELGGAATFTGIELSMGVSPQPRVFYCDSLAFYKEALPPLKFKEQPRRNLKPYPGQIVGVNTGAGTLPFPTREDTILPVNVEKNFQVTTRQTGPRAFEFRYQGRDGAVLYRYAPAAGDLGEITTQVNRGQPFQPMAGGGVRFEDNPGAGTLVSAALAGDTVEARFRYGPHAVEYQLRLRQKSLVLDVRADGGAATELNFGRVAGVANPKLFLVPYITYRPLNPRILMSGDAAHPVFTSVWFDWYRTNASEPYCSEKPSLFADGGEINGGMRYIPRTDGKRNNLFERIFLTNSPVYGETLPTIANPKCLNPEIGKQVVWTVTAPSTFTSDHQRCLEIRSYGLDKIMQHSHEVTWRDEGDSFTMRLHAAPQKGGDAMLKWYIGVQSDMGWRQGVYTNYTDFAPVNTNWNPDFVQRLPDGEWRRAWMRNYALKPVEATEKDDYYAQRIKARFNPGMSYTDVHTAIPPWEYVDFDARVPGGGTFADTYYAWGQLLLNDQRVYGVAESEGTMQWMYAGLESGSYGWVYTDANLLTEPLDVGFHLMQIHPLQSDYGMGGYSRYMAAMDPDYLTSPKRREYVDLFLATTIAYGNMGWLVKDYERARPFYEEAMARSYYMMQQLQQQYAFVRPRAIEYAARDGRLLNETQAHATGVFTDSQLHVSYENGTEVYVNRSADRPWIVKDARGNAVELPANGWMVYNTANKFFEISANVDGRRVDYADSPEYEFLDGRGAWTHKGRLAATGSAALRRKAGGALELIDIYGNTRLAFQSSSPGSLQAYDPAGKDLGTVALNSQAGWSEFQTVPNGRRYVFTPRHPAK